MSLPLTKPYKVVVVGLSKTGTSTLKVMLSGLGYTVCGPRKDLLTRVRAGDIAAIDPVLDQYDAFEDWPWPLTYRYVLERYGDRAKFILSTRGSFEQWYTSLIKHGRSSSPFRGMYPTYGYYRPDGREAEFRKIYETHNEDVRQFFASRPAQCVEFCLENGDGWDKLCGLLGEPVPDLPVPRQNKAADRNKPVNVFINELIAPVYRRVR
jgi:hypothetical protein